MARSQELTSRQHSAVVWAGAVAVVWAAIAALVAAIAQTATVERVDAPAAPEAGSAFAATVDASLPVGVALPDEPPVEPPPTF